MKPSPAAVFGMSEDVLVEQFAPLSWNYFCKLQTQGFSPEQAFTLTRDLCRALTAPRMLEDDDKPAASGT